MRCWIIYKRSTMSLELVRDRRYKHTTSLGTNILVFKETNQNTNNHIFLVVSNDQGWDLPHDNCVELPTWDLHRNVTESVSDEFLTKTYRRHIPGFMSPFECQLLIAMSEAVGYEEALIQTRDHGQVMNKEVRDNYRVVIDAPDLATLLWDKIEALGIPDYVDDMHDEPVTWKPIGLNERFRFYRYEYGQQFRRHADGAFKRSDDEVSFVTVLIYLNDDFNGGETQFFYPNEAVTPQMGMLYLFKHRQLHQGDPVTTGAKYVLRTDIMYKRQ